MGSPLVSTAVPTTAYQFEDKLKSNTSYYWRVRAEKPHPSEWSAVFNFATQTEKPGAPPPKITNSPHSVLVIMTIGILLVIVIVILILRNHLTRQN
jgi:hypothetical protein